MLIQNSDLARTSGANLGANGQLSVGRTQSVATAMVYQREVEIETFVPKPTFDVEAEISTIDGRYKFKGKAEMPKECKENKDRLLDLFATYNIDCGNHYQGEIAEVRVTEKRTKPYQLHSLSTLQVVMNRKHKMNPKDTLKTVQSLYDKKYLSYPRSDCQFITEAEFEYIQERVEQYKQALVAFTGKQEMYFTTVNDQPQSRYVDNKKVQEHYAIVTTRNIPTQADFQSFSKEEQIVYLEILRRVLGMFHGDYVYDEKLIFTNIRTLLFKSRGTTEKEKGFKTMWEDEQVEKSSKKSKAKTDSEDDEGGNQALPNVSKHEKIDGLILLKEGKTKPPSFLTEGDLIHALKHADTSKIIDLEDEDDKSILKAVEGIATEATRAELIETIKKRGYVEVKSNRLRITPKGRLLCQVLEGTLLTNPSMTAKWETYLSEIGKGTKTINGFIANIQKFIDGQIASAPTRIQNTKTIQTAIQTALVDETIGTCPFCKKSIVEHKSFYGCTGYKDGCDFTIPKTLLGKRITKKNVQQLLEDGLTNTIKGFKKKNVKEGAKPTFDARLKLNRQEKKVEFFFG